MTPELIDVDCNLLHSDMKTLQKGETKVPWNILEEDAVRNANIVAMISPSSTIAESEIGIELLKAHPPPFTIKTTVGVHPYHVNDESLIFSNNGENNDGKKDDIAIFLDWFHQNGGFRSTAVTISKFVDFGGHGLLAKSDIKPYDILFKVPKSIIITSDKVKNDYFRLIRDKRENYSLSEIQRKESEYEHMETKIQNLLPNMASQDAIIAQRLMAECALGERSLFEPYLRMLPNQIPR